MNKSEDHYTKADPNAQPNYIPLDVIALIEAIASARGTFWQKIASPRFLLTLLTQIPVIVLWINGNVSGQWAAVACAVLTAIYTLGEAYVHGQASQAAARVMEMHVATAAGTAPKLLP